MDNLCAREISCGAIVRDVSYFVERGEPLCILGSIGSGKSTSIRGVAGGLPLSGQLFIDGRDLAGNRVALNYALGFLRQEDALPDWQSAATLLYLAARNHGYGVLESRSRARKLVRAFGLDEYKNRPIGRCSGGQRRAIAVAHELVHSPKLVLCDEPTSNSDPSCSDHVMQTLVETCRNRLLIVATHAVRYVHLFTNVLLMTEGRAVYFGPPDGLLAHFDVTDHRDIYTRLESANIPDLVERYRNSETASAMNRRMEGLT